MSALHANDLSFSYDGRISALVDLTFEVPEGSIFAVLGPNGSGKTTLFQLLLGLLVPTDGELFTIDGPPDDRANKRHIGWVSSEISQALLLTLDEYFELLKTTQPDFDIDFAHDLLEPFELTSARQRLLGALSHGMRKKAQLVGAMAHRPRVLLLDEPFSGLDPQSHFILEAALTELRSRGSTIVFASHQIEVVDHLATHVAVLQDGRLRAVGEPAELCRTHGADSLRSLYLAVTGASEQTRQHADLLARLLERSTALPL